MTEFRVRREGTLTFDDHEGITRMLAAAFPGYAHGYTGVSSWAGAQPEVRITAHDESGVTAHAGVRRMFVQVGNSGYAEDQLVAGVGMVAVRPDLHGTGLGGRLTTAIHNLLSRMRVPFGLLETSDADMGYYERQGWHPLTGAVGHYNGFTADEPARVTTQDHGWLLLPVARTLDEWPLGDIHWNGQMV